MNIIFYTQLQTNFHRSDLLDLVVRSKQKERFSKAGVKFVLILLFFAPSLLSKLLRSKTKPIRFVPHVPCVFHWLHLYYGPIPISNTQYHRYSGFQISILVKNISCVSIPFDTVHIAHVVNNHRKFENIFTTFISGESP